MVSSRDRTAGMKKSGLFGPELAARAEKKRARPLDGPSVLQKPRSNCDCTLFGPAVSRSGAANSVLATRLSYVGCALQLVTMMRHLPATRPVRAVVR